MKKLLNTLIFCLLFMPTMASAQPSDNDILLETMVQKGYLSEDDAQIIKEQTKGRMSARANDAPQGSEEYVTKEEFESLKKETQEYINKQVKNTKRYTKEYFAEHMQDGALMALPDWVRQIKLKGDIRLRSQYERRKSTLPSAESRQRGRLRARLGLIAKVTPQVKAGMGVATSEGGDPRSTNITFEDSFERGDIRLDHAYIQYQPAPWGKVIGGKYAFPDYLWTPTDLLLDKDINPTGAGLHLGKSIAPVTVFFNAGSWVIEEITTQPNDPFVIYGQPGIRLETDRFDLTAVGNIYHFSNLKGKFLDNTACTNTGYILSGSTCAGGTLTYDFRDKGGSLEMGYKIPVLGRYKRLAFFGDFIRNDQAPNGLNRAWAYGATLGDLDVADSFDWQLRYQYSRLDKDAFPDIFPDSDRYEGRTGISGHNMGVILGLTKNTSLGFEYYHDRRIKTSTKLPQTLYQVDVNVKF